jgi:A/G-specific adenine glycosylase
MPRDIYNQFSNRLLAWHKTLDRPLPWKGTKDPYLIWVSEIILQQTRAVQATPYYLKITDRFPDVVSLATAPIDDLLSMWQGLGYYSRARNLHHSANVIVDQHEGVFPVKYEDIIALKGVGKYTAAAISSFAYGQAYPVIDGNVIRIISRFFDIAEAIDTKEGRHKIDTFVDLVFDGKRAAPFNQAIMDFGATVCVPKNPICHECPFHEDCQALANGTIQSRPIKSKKLKRKKRNFNFLFFEKNDHILIEKRTANDIWKGLYQLPLIEGLEYSKRGKLMEKIQQVFGFHSDATPVYTHRQLLTHQEIHSIVWSLDLVPENQSSSDLIWVAKDKLENYGFPKTMTLFFEDYLYIG